MDLEATAQALAPEPVQTEQVAATVETVEAEPDYGAIYDKMTTDAPVEAAEAPQEAPEAPAEATPAPEPVEAPTDLPVGVRKHWGALPEDVREAMATAHREMARSNAEMGRLVKGIAPIRDVLMEVIRERPELANVTPAQLARDTMTLARISAGFARDPIGAFMKLAEEKGLTEPLRKHFGGQPQEAQQTAALQNEIRALKQQLSRAADPEFIREQVSAVTAQERVLSDVQAFAAKQDHWAEVEAYMPKVIPLIREAMPDASGKDVLAKAYDLALQTYRPDLKAKAQAAVEAAAQPDPERTQAALKAKSINVTGRTTGQARELTEEERYAAAYDRASRK